MKGQSEVLIFPFYALETRVTHDHCSSVEQTKVLQSKQWADGHVTGLLHCLSSLNRQLKGQSLGKGHPYNPNQLEMAIQIAGSAEYYGG